MNEKHTLSKTLEKKNFIHKDAVYAFRVWTVVHTDEGGYVESDYIVHVWADKSFSISDRSDFISISAEASKVFMRCLNEVIASPLDTQREA